MNTETRIGWINKLPEVGPAFTERRINRAKEIDAAIKARLAEIRRLRKNASQLLNEAYTSASAEWTPEEVKTAMDTYIRSKGGAA